MKARDFAPAALLAAPVLIVALYFTQRGSEPHTAAEPAPAPATAASLEAVQRATVPAPAPSPVENAVAGDEAAGLSEIESLLSTNPQRALALVREQNEKFPTGELRDDRDYAGIRAWVNLKEIGKARTAATKFYEAYPDSELVPQVHALTGMHLPPHLGPR